jgi:hypothetical protein
VVGVHFQLAGLPGWGELVLDHLGAHAGAEDPAGVVDRLGLVEVQANRGVVAKRPPTGGVQRLAGGAGALAELVGRHSTLAYATPTSYEQQHASSAPAA